MMEPLTIEVLTPQVEIGEDLTFTLAWNAPKPARGIFVALILEVNGRGDDVKRQIMDLTAPTRGLTGSTQLTFPLGFNLTPSYSGNLFVVSWKIRARLDLKRQVDPVAEHGVQILPSGWKHVVAMHRGSPSRPADRQVNDLPIINPDAPPPGDGY